METPQDRDRVGGFTDDESNERKAQGGQQGGGQKPGQGGGQQGGNQKPGQGGGQQGSRQVGNATEVPNESRSTAGSEGRKDQGMRTGASDYEIEGGRKGAGKIPNPDDDNDRGSRSGFRGNAAEESAFDANDSEEGFGKNVNRNQDQSNRLLNPK